MSLTALLKTSVLILGLTLSGLSFIIVTDSSPILFESLQSKTHAGGPVFNKVYLLSTNGVDKWRMLQTNDGLDLPEEEWDQVGVDVKPTAGAGFKAEFFQLFPGANILSNQQKMPLKATCYLCHSSGPRAIRPNYDSQLVKLSAYNQLRVMYWNLKIKLYGPVESVSASPEGGRQFRLDHPLATAALDVKSCTSCHDGTNKLGHRSKLTRQNMGSIKFLIEQKQMPPPTHSLSQEDLRLIKLFIGDAS